MSAQLEADLASGAPPEALVLGDSLSRVDVANWRGQASTGFLDVIHVEPGRWRTAADAFNAAAAALEGYTANLAPARELARQARQTYQRYETTLASAAQLAGVPSPVPGPDPTNGVLSVQDRMRIGARYQQMNAIAASSISSADALRRHAIALLEQARRTVEQAGDHAADTLDHAMAMRTPLGSWNSKNVFGLQQDRGRRADD